MVSILPLVISLKLLQDHLHFIAESMILELVHSIQSSKFFSLLLDGSTDAGNINNEVFLLAWFGKNGVDERVYTKSSYFKVSKPQTVSAQGLYDVLQEALLSLGIQTINADECTKFLVGIGTDGAAAGGGLK